MEGIFINFAEVRRKFSFLFLAITVFACQEKPAVPRAKMVPLLKDCMMLEAGNQVKYNFAHIPQYVWQRDYAFVCKKHGVDTADFRQSLNYMEKHPEEFASVLEEVITALQKEEVNKNIPKH